MNLIHRAWRGTLQTLELTGRMTLFALAVPFIALSFAVSFVFTAMRLIMNSSRSAPQTMFVFTASFVLFFMAYQALGLFALMTLGFVIFVSVSCLHAAFLLSPSRSAA